MQKVLNSTKQIVLVVFAFLFPLFFVNLFQEPHVTSRLGLLSVFVVFLILLESIKVLETKKITLNSAPLSLPLALLAVVYIVSGILRTPNRMEAFFLPGTVSFVILSFLLYQFVANQDSSSKEKITTGLILSGIVASVVTLFSSVGVWQKIPQLSAISGNVYFTLLGGILPTAIFLLILLPVSFEKFINKKAVAEKIFYMVSAFIIAMGLAVSVYNLLPGKATSLKIPSMAVTWSVAVDSVKLRPVFGMGPGNYLSAFSRFLPISYNSTDLYSVRFPIGRSFLLTNLSEVGLLGFSILIFLLLTIYKKSVSKKITGSKVSLLLFVVIMAVLPVGNFVFVIFILLAALSFKNTNLYSIPLNTPVLKVFSAIAVVAVLGISYIFARPFLAEYYFSSGITHLSKAEAGPTYEAISKAISLSPSVDRYHATLAQVSIALAEAQVASISDGTQVSEEQRNTISLLLENAIKEGKIAVNLNTGRSRNWEILARIYQSIGSFAQGADQFAIQTYSQAIFLDPVNPSLRIALGGMYYTQGKFDEAIRAFELAVLAKQDLPNAYYNLAIALREKGETQRAIDTLRTALSLVDTDSPDFGVLTKEIDNLETKKNTEPAQTENLTPPQEPQEAVIDPKIEVPTTDELLEVEEIDIPTE